MIQSIKVNLELMEMLLYYWKATSEKEKVGEKYIYSMVEHEHMKPLYNDNFSPEQARQTLSAISNREIFKPSSREAGRFWNNHMWMMEDLGITEAMMQPVKQLNLDHLVQNADYNHFDGPLEIIFVPGHLENLYQTESQLYINFFKLMVSMADGSVTIEEKSLTAYIEALCK